MTINTRGGGVTHTHTHIPDKGQQCSLVLIQSRLVRVGWWSVSSSVVCVCALSIGCAPHACEYRLVGCAYAKKSVWLSLLYIPYTHIYTHTQAETAQRTKLCVLCCLWRVFVCVCVVVVVGSGSAGGVMWWGLSLLLLLLLLQQQQRQI